MFFPAARSVLLPAALLAIATLGGCLITTTSSETGRTVSAADVDQIKPGTTKRAEVIGLLGEPDESTKTEDGEACGWTYSRHSSATVLFLFHSESTRDGKLSVTFDSAGIVKQVSRK